MHKPSPLLAKHDTQDLCKFSQASAAALIDVLPDTPTAHFSHPLLDGYLHFYGLADLACQSRFSIWPRSYWLATRPYRLMQYYWQPPKARGTVLLLHGYFDHVGLYRPLIAWCLQQGLAVLAFDLPGHGLSSGERGGIDSFDSYAIALQQVVQQNTLALPEPFYAIGQSTGCAVIVNALLQKVPIAFERCILLAPLVRIRHWPWLRVLYFCLRPYLSSVARGFSCSSHDEAWRAFLMTEPLQARRIPLSWLGAMDQWYQQVQQLAEQGDKAHYPLMIVQGTRDTTVDWRYNLKALQGCFPNSHFHYIPGARHQLVREAPAFWQQVAAVLAVALK